MIDTHPSEDSHHHHTTSNNIHAQSAPPPFHEKPDVESDQLIPKPNESSIYPPLSPFSFAVISKSLRNYTRNPTLLKELAYCCVWFLTGLLGPRAMIRMWGVNQRPIPYQVTQSGDVMLDLTLTNPYVTDVNFSSKSLIFLCVILPPILITLLSHWFQPNNNSTVHSGLCSFLFAIGLSELITTTLKLYVGRLRPNFYAMCGFDPSTLSCTSPHSHQTEARMSFPSGHSSLSFCTMTLLSLVLLLGLFSDSRKSKAWNLASTLTPLGLATWIAASRLVDHWHHPSDVLAGCGLGVFCGIVSYWLWHPSMVSGLSMTYNRQNSMAGKEKIEMMVVS